MPRSLRRIEQDPAARDQGCPARAGSQAEFEAMLHTLCEPPQGALCVAGRFQGDSALQESLDLIRWLGLSSRLTRRGGLVPAAPHPADASRQNSLARA